MGFEYCKITKEPMKLFPVHKYHFHSDYEIYYFVSGDADYLVEGREYHLSPHSMVLLSSNVLHSIRMNSNTDYIRYCLYLSPKELLPERRNLLLSPFSKSPSPKHQAIFYENLEEYHFEELFRQLQSLEDLPEELRFQYRPIFLEAFLAKVCILLQTRNESTTSVATVSPVILSLIDYLNHHIREPHSLEALSQQFFISKNYMNRAFKKATGTTIIDYILFKRVLLAKQYIADGESASKAALSVGFTDYSSFYRSYKRVFGVSPSADK